MTSLPCTSRRDFFTACACLIAGGCASVAARPVAINGDVVRLSLAGYPELTRAGGSAKILPVGAADPVYVLALGENRYVALSPICTHRGCTVNIEGPRLVCPCHGSTYDREGRVLRGPAERPLGRHELTVSGGDLIIRLRAA